MARAEPSMIRVAASMSLAFRSFIFASAIWASCERRMVPALILPGSAEPDFSRAAFLIRKDAGGVLGVKENGRSARTVITTGLGAPLPSPCLAPLYALHTSL